MILHIKINSPRCFPKSLHLAASLVRVWTSCCSLHIIGTQYLCRMHMCTLKNLQSLGFFFPPVFKPIHNHRFIPGATVEYGSVNSLFLEPLFYILGFTASVGLFCQPPNYFLDFCMSFLLFSSQCHQIIDLKVTNLIMLRLYVLPLVLEIKHKLSHWPQLALLATWPKQISFPSIQTAIPYPCSVLRSPIPCTHSLLCSHFCSATIPFPPFSTWPIPIPILQNLTEAYHCCGECFPCRIVNGSFFLFYTHLDCSIFPFALCCSVNESITTAKFGTH